MIEKRSVSKMSEVVDQAILLFDAGEEDTAIQMLIDINFSREGINRVLLEPSKRRKYMKDILS